MPNKPRPENRHRMVRVEDDLWAEAGEACRELGTDRSTVERYVLRALASVYADHPDWREEWRA